MPPRFSKVPALILTVLIIVCAIFTVPKAKNPSAMAALIAGVLIVILASEYQRFRRFQTQPVPAKPSKPAVRSHQPSRLGEKGLQWFCWDAHVDILLPESLATAWEGTKPPTDGRLIETQFRFDPSQPACDYDRACDVAASIATIPVGTGTGIVIKEAPLITWVAQEKGGCLVVALEWRELSDELALRAVADTPPEAFGAPSFTFDSPDSRLVLFAAADTFGSKHGYGHLDIELPAGRYRVTTAEWKEDATLLLHSFQPI